MKTIQIPVTSIDRSSPEYATAKTDHVLTLSRSLKRFGLGGVIRGAHGRRETNGDLVSGPWAYTYGLGTCIAANPEHGTFGEIKRNLAAGREHVVEEGDQIVFDGVTYAVTVTDGFGKPQADSRPYTDYSFIRLVAVDGPTQQTCGRCAGKGWTMNGYRREKCSQCEGRGFIVSSPCGCADRLCPAHRGADCRLAATTTLYRIDMDDATGTSFCDGCAQDAIEAGVFQTETVRHANTAAEARAQWEAAPAVNDGGSDCPRCGNFIPEDADGHECGELGVGPMAQAERRVPPMVTVIAARLEGATDASDWAVIAKQLRAAARLADKAAKGGF